MNGNPVYVAPKKNLNYEKPWRDAMLKQGSISEVNGHSNGYQKTPIIKGEMNY